MSKLRPADKPSLIPGITHRTGGFDIVAWTRKACEQSGVPFGIEDPIALEKLRILSRAGDQG